MRQFRFASCHTTLSVAAARFIGPMRGILASHRAKPFGPTLILRNWIAEAAIRAAEKGDYSKVRTVFEMQETPFKAAFCSMRPAFAAAAACSVVAKGAGASGGGSSDASGEEKAVSEAEREFLVPPPAWAASLLCTCSS